MFRRNGSGLEAGALFGRLDFLVGRLQTFRGLGFQGVDPLFLLPDQFAEIFRIAESDVFEDQSSVFFRQSARSDRRDGRIPNRLK